MALVMGMATDIMVSQKSQTESCLKFQLGKICVAIILASCCAQTAFARILGVEIKPSISVSEMYSDNLRFRSNTASSATASSPEGGFLTQIAPGVNIVRNSAHSKFNLNARLQYLYYEGVDIDSKIYPQLQMNSKTELYDDAIYLDSTSRISQGNASAIGSFSPNNVAVSPVNSTTYSSFRLSPYWKPHLGGYAEGEVRLSYMTFSNTSSTNANGANLTTNTVGNLGSDTYQEYMYFQNGKQFDQTGLSWRLNFNNQDQHYSSATTSITRYRSANGELSYRLIGDISLFIQSGYYDNAYSNSSSVTPRNGVYVTPGLSWKPSSHFSIAAGYGINSYFSTLTWEPSQRTYLQVSYRDSKVGGSNYGGRGGSYGIGGGGYGMGSTGYGMGGSGYGGGGAGSNSNFPTGQLGVGNAGSVWNVSLRHKSKNTSWNASYFTTSTTIQEVLSQVSTFDTPTDLEGNAIGDTTANERNLSLPNYTNDVIIGKRAQVNLTWILSRLNFYLSAYQGNYTYSSTNRTQDMLGVNTRLTWKFNQHTSAQLFGNWQTSEYQTKSNISSSGKTDYISVSISLIRQINEFITGSLNYSYFQNNSTQFTVGNIPGSNDQNRITASVNIIF